MSRQAFSDDDEYRKPHHTWAGHAFTVTIGITALFGIHGVYVLATEGLPKLEKRNLAESKDPGTLALIVIPMVGIAVAITLSYYALHYVKRHAGSVIKYSLYFLFANVALAAVLALFTGQIVVAIFAILMAGLYALYLWWNWRLVGFAEACLRLAIIALFENFTVVWYSLALIFVNLLWVVVCCFAAVSIIKLSNMQGLAGIIAFPLYWGSFFFYYLVFSATAGALGRWLLKNDRNSAKDAFSFAASVMYGPIALLSAVLAVVQILRNMAQSIADDQEASGGARILACILMCILGCIQGLIEYISLYALIFINMYGGTLQDAGKKLQDLWEKTGFTAVINDDFSTAPLNLICLIVGFLGFCVSFANSYFLFQHTGEIASAFGAMGMFMAMIICSLMLSPLPAFIKTIFVIYVNEKSEFSKKKPELFTQFEDALRKYNYLTI